jgi:hypothetical protein
MAGDDRRAGKQAAQVGGAVRLPWLRAQRDQVLGEGAIGPEQGLHRHRGRHIGDAQQRTQVPDGEQLHPEDAIGAVDQRQALLRTERERLDPGLGERLGRRPTLAGVVADLPLTDQRQGAVREGREVAARPQGPVFEHDWGDSGVEEL